MEKILNQFSTKCYGTTPLQLHVLINVAPADLYNVILLPKKYGLGQLKLRFGQWEIYTEWIAKKSVFQFLCRELDLLTSIDLFTTRINTQLPIFTSYRPGILIALDWPAQPFYTRHLWWTFTCRTRFYCIIHSTNRYHYWPA